MPRALITGASGMLGSAVMRRMAGVFRVHGLAHTLPAPGTTSLDLLDPDAIRRIKSLPWDILVHCAAFRSPEFCEENPDVARRLNADVPGALAAVAARRSARFIHISTDYVFPGTHAPYSETDPTGPVNAYGRTKAAAERHVIQAYPDAVVLRVPALFADSTPSIKSPMIEDAIQAIVVQTPVALDDRIVRFPTFTDDIAAVILFLAQADFRGILHASAAERATRYEWTRQLARLLGWPHDHIGRAATDASRKAPRPVNAQLSTATLKKLGGPLPRAYSRILPNLRRLRAVGPGLFTDPADVLTAAHRMDSAQPR